MSLRTRRSPLESPGSRVEEVGGVYCEGDDEDGGVYGVEVVEGVRTVELEVELRTASKEIGRDTSRSPDGSVQNHKSST